jgi:hypothetical protein
LFGPRECSSYLLRDEGFLLLGYDGELEKYNPETGESRKLLGGEEYLPITWDEAGSCAAAVLINEDEKNDVFCIFDIRSDTRISSWELPKCSFYIQDWTMITKAISLTLSRSRNEI